MTDLTMEQAFTARKLAHIYAILKFKMMEYYATIEMGKVNLPDFLRDDTPEKKAEKEIDWLLHNDKKRFYELYEQAYVELRDRGILD